MRPLLAGLAIVVIFLHGEAALGAPTFANQGVQWTQAARADFYSRDQGSKMIPLRWLRALKQPNGQPFLAAALARYGYLENPGNSDGLPVGFTSSGPVGSKVVGMTCAACHTREITAEGKSIRIDGGPAIVDFQGLLADLDKAVGSVLATDAAFRLFAMEVLGPPAPSEDDVLSLRGDVGLWHLRFHTLMERALPAAGWGPGRADAVGMIFNRLTGLDLGPPPSYLIPENIKRADAPTRYPFIWNSPIQDKTQWPGFADNGSDTLALSRNVGQVIGVFATFAPKNRGFFVDYLAGNSTNFDGLLELEHLVKKIGPPKWPWTADRPLAARGKLIFAREPQRGGCKECHGIARGEVRFFNVKTWKTPVMNVGTDTRQYQVLQWKSKSGVLQGAYIPVATQPLQETDLAVNILKTAVIGSVAEYLLFGKGVAPTEEARAARTPVSRGPVLEGATQLPRLPPELRDMEGTFNAVPAPPDARRPRLEGAAATADLSTGAYEARVLEGIWAAAPYLHNGSVPTLADLLEPASRRPKVFKVGPAYDIRKVGLAVDQTKFDQSIVTTDCNALDSGNSNCGHEYGTGLTDQEKKALLEYLKTL